MKRTKTTTVDAENTAEDRIIRQRKWAIKRKFAIRDRLYWLGREFDKQPKHNFNDE